MSLLKEPRDQHELIILAAFGGRPDHVLANQLLSAQLAAEGWRLGSNRWRDHPIYLDDQSGIGFASADLQEKPLAFSVNAIGCQVDGLTGNDNLLYPLNEISLSTCQSSGASTIELRKVELFFVCLPVLR